MDDKRVRRIRELILIGLVSDDELMDTLVLKGGNAIDIIHGAALRSSIDLDFSLSSDLPEGTLAQWTQRFSKLLNTSLGDEGFCAFDVIFTRRPDPISEDLADFWGGYLLEFKVTTKERFELEHRNQRRLRTTAEEAAPGHKKKFHVDFSKYEFCDAKEAQEIDGFTVYVYTPTMIVCEKLRAICQQMPEYCTFVRSSTASARARDFFDICALVEHFKLNLTTEENRQLLSAIFYAKRVPLCLLGKISESRNFHEPDFVAVQATVKPRTKVRDFDYYFNFVVSIAAALEALRKK